MDNKTKELILSMCDHTLLKQDATIKEIFETCRDAEKFGCKTVCIPPCYVKYARENFPNLAICTVIGFPNGNSTTAVKCFEAATAVAEGADEIDMVINIGWLKAYQLPDILDEINAVKRACVGKTLKVIIETGMLNEYEKITACKVVNSSHADFIKTSTGFAAGGATVEDVKLMAELCPNKLIKAAGGISSFEEAEKLFEAGACRLGTSKLVKIAKAEEES